MRYAFLKLTSLAIFFRIKPNYKYLNFKKFSILLPVNHLLPEYLKNHPKYDRQLPIISKSIKKNETIIDIGANVGDSLASMVNQNPNPNFLCIEPDDEFFNYLIKNIKRIRLNIKNKHIYAVKSFIGKKISNVSLEKKSGTAKAKPNSGNLLSIPLDEVLKDFEDLKKIKLIKIDTDGFDYDVIMSSLNTIRKHKPMLFFECDCAYEFQKRNYLNTIKKLHSLGYKNWTVFDNYGQIVVLTSDLRVIFELIDYIWQQTLKKTTRTIYYFDFLTYCNNDKSRITKVMQDIKKYN